MKEVIIMWGPFCDIYSPSNEKENEESNNK